MRIYVTQEDIDKGCQGDSLGCPIARAVTRATGRQFNIGSSHIQTFDPVVWAGASYLATELPQEARDFVRNFDSSVANRVKPMPFHFDIDLYEFEPFEPVPMPEPAPEPVLELVPEPVLEEELELVGV